MKKCRTIKNYTNRISAKQSLAISISADRDKAKIDDIIICTAIITNNGNVSVEDIKFCINISPNAKFVADSFCSNFSFIENIDINLINIGSINIGESRVISFEILVLDIFEDSENIICEVKGSYTSKATENSYSENEFVDCTIIKIIDYDNFFIKKQKIIDSEISLNLKANQNCVTLNDKIAYKLEIANNSNIIMKDINIKFFLSEYVSFINESIQIDENDFSHLDIIDGINIKFLRSKEVKEITFFAKVNENKVSVLESFCVANYSYEIIEYNKILNLNTKSNTSKIMLEKNELTISKIVSKDSVELLDIINYSICIENTGSINIFDIILKEECSLGLEIIDSKIYINDKPVIKNIIDKSVNIGNLYVRESCIVTYKIRVTANTESSKLYSNLYTEYKYKLSSGETGTRKFDNIKLELDISNQSFKELILDSIITINKNKKALICVDSVTIDPIISQRYVINSQKGVSDEGQILSGKLLIVSGIIDITVEYTTIEESVFCEKFSRRFTTDIVLPLDYKEKEYENIFFDVKSINSTILDKKSIAIGTVILFTVGTPKEEFLE